MIPLPHVDSASTPQASDPESEAGEALRSRHPPSLAMSYCASCLHVVECLSTPNPSDRRWVDTAGRTQRDWFEKISGMPERTCDLRDSKNCALCSLLYQALEALLGQDQAHRLDGEQQLRKISLMKRYSPRTSDLGRLASFAVSFPDTAPEAYPFGSSIEFDVWAEESQSTPTYCCELLNISTIIG